jgi:hypothetical protein
MGRVFIYIGLATKIDFAALEAIAEYIIYVGYDHKGIGIEVFDDIRKLGYLTAV